METVQDIIGWVVGFLLVQVASVGLSVFTLVRSAKLLPKDLTNADLKNKSEEAGVAVKMEELAERAASKVLKQEEKIDLLQKKLVRLECELNNYKEENDALREWAEALVRQLELAKTLVPELEQHKLVPAKMRPVQKTECEGTK